MLKSITDEQLEQENDLEQLRTYVRQALAILETENARLDQLRAETQNLRDELNRLNAEQGKPTIRLDAKILRDISSDKEQMGESPKCHKGRVARNYKVPITKPPIICKCDPEKLPPDAIFKGYHKIIIQNLKIEFDNEK
ncbi:MAG: hypothetical protein PHN79_07525 [Methanoregula sp.]|nr:hypothetical protein [Methanoregula sp.]